MNLVDFIAARRDGRTHSSDELIEFARRVGASEGISDEQIGAWLMAAFLNPLTASETADLTRAMALSGEVLELEGLPKPWVDKHSTGGVGDKTTIVLLPLLAACGLTMVKMSGRGLGITGGTVDKLESIPGFRMNLSPQEMIEQAGQIGLAITGQTPNLAPADKRLYAIRDVTATVASVPLIVSSILSKKLAGGAEKLVLDVKCGSGAFMGSLEDARILGRALVDTANAAGLPTIAAITDMNQPLGSAVGNALEVREAMRVLAGDDLNGPETRFRNLCLELAAETLAFAGVAASEEEGIALATSALENGSAMAKAQAWVEAQSGAEYQESKLAQSPERKDVLARRSGWLRRADAGAVGRFALDLGAGRKQKTDAINHSVGVVLHKSVGDEVLAGEPIATIYSAGSYDEAGLASAFEVVDMEVEPIPAILERVL